MTLGLSLYEWHHSQYLLPSLDVLDANKKKKALILMLKQIL